MIDPSKAGAADELPSVLRDYTKLAPLGPKATAASSANGAFAGKSIGLDPDEIARRLANDLVYGATGRGGYFVSGDLSKDLFKDDCVFEDPTNRVDSLDQYQTALGLLFDPERSTVRLLGEGLAVDSDSDTAVTTITGRLRSRGYLGTLPWKPYITAYETTIVYTLDPSTGLVARQDQTWSKGAKQALRETFSPAFNDPPPRSDKLPTSDEPREVSLLFDTVNGRRPYEYSDEERIEIDGLVERIVGLGKSSTSTSTSTTSSSTTSASLEGTWVLAYLQPGPDGAGIDRRIPFFPDFDFNDSFQSFSGDPGGSGTSTGTGTATVTNIGQVLGSWVEVRVGGSLRELALSGHGGRDSDGNASGSGSSTRRFEASIDGGKVCFGTTTNHDYQKGNNNSNSDDAFCPLGLPMIKGRGLFDSLYLGDRLRIGQNLNGGGARVVQVRL
eukprot:jgi/Psemu1/180985/e_gw1.18.240.1